MLLLLAIVQNEDAPALSRELINQGLRFTQINSTGGLFAFGSAAFLLGVEENQYDTVLAAIRETCHTRTRYIGTLAGPEPIFFFSTPMEVEVGGAVVFGVPIERRIRIRDNAVAESVYDATAAKQSAAEAESHNGGQAKGGTHMKLMVAIVQGEDADDVIRALLAAEHRLTRINTTGGFLRRGNATLLIGVEPNQVDDVIQIIQANTRPRNEPAPLQKGFPAYSATIFVLDASHFVRL